MTEATKPSIKDMVPFIYEPVADSLQLVVSNLRELAGGADIAGDGLLEQAVGGGGKKVRPVVTLLSGSFHPADEQVLVTMATAVELLHIATLIHDDTVDKADTRRGRATVSSMWGNEVAVLLGDYVFATSATFVCDTGNIRVVRRFSETIMELAQGELAERFSNHDWGQSIHDYNTRIYNKTASLFCTAAESGGVLSGAPEAECRALKDYGYNIGMAFQIMDDVLDFMGTEEEMGKPVGNDLLQGTLTLPTLLFIQRHPDEPLVRRLQDGSRDPGDLRAMAEAVSNSPVIADTLATMDDYRNRARTA
ncbi:MAG: polyprenyl synthetase family protein, partial [Dehalococcoidia bacterium]